MEADLHKSLGDYLFFRYIVFDSAERTDRMSLALASCGIHLITMVSKMLDESQESDGGIGSFNIKKTRHMVALSALMVLALLIQRQILIKFRQFFKQNSLAVPRLSSNRSTLTPLWMTVQ